MYNQSFLQNKPKHCYSLSVVALSQLKGTDMPVQPRSNKNATKKLKTSTKKGKKCTTVNQGNSKGKYHKC